MQSQRLVNLRLTLSESPIFTPATAFIILPGQGLAESLCSSLSSRPSVRNNDRVQLYFCFCAVQFSWRSGIQTCIGSIERPIGATLRKAGAKALGQIAPQRMQNPALYHRIVVSQES